MNVTKRSIITGDTHTWDLPITREQVAAWQAGALIQDVMPNLTSEEREFLINGTTPAECAKHMGTEED